MHSDTRHAHAHAHAYAICNPQEIVLYSRQLKEQVQQVLGAEEEDSASSSTPPISRPALNPELAEALLQAPMQAIQQLSGEHVGYCA